MLHEHDWQMNKIMPICISNTIFKNSAPFKKGHTSLLCSILIIKSNGALPLSMPAKEEIYPNLLFGSAQLAVKTIVDDLSLICIF